MTDYPDTGARLPPPNALAHKFLAENSRGFAQAIPAMLSSDELAFGR